MVSKITCLQHNNDITIIHSLWWRYGQFLFLEPSDTHYAPVPRSIAKWNYTQFIQEYHLGHKLSSNFFQAEYWLFCIWINWNQISCCYTIFYFSHSVFTTVSYLASSTTPWLIIFEYPHVRIMMWRSSLYRVPCINMNTITYPKTIYLETLYSDYNRYLPVCSTENEMMKHMSTPLRVTGYGLRTCVLQIQYDRVDHLWIKIVYDRRGS